MNEQDTKAQILAAATAVFAEKGFAKASMNDIVRAAGLSKGGVYWHFKSKDAIVAAIFDQFFTGQLLVLDTVKNSDGSAGDKILQLAALTGGDLVDMAVQFPSPLEFYAMAAREEYLTQALQSYLIAYQEYMSAFIQQGIDEGDFREVDVADTAVTLGALFEGIFLLWAVYPTEIDMDRQLKTAVHLLLDGLRKAELK
ncbi:MAG: TetR/AcrR family transcriptional regulator [Anaerolineales bacterium]|nr:TetR/AcrR family transcriptional regulator [Anaerolineales bacterium]